MTKTVSLPDLIYADLVSVSGTLTTMARRPISLGMTVQIMTIATRTFLSIPVFQEAVRRTLTDPKMMSAEQWEETWNEISKEVLRRKKGSQ